ncbi:MAG: prepilin-type N-terminal cleavage/methylation domain-containing protein [SAR202 cluster bacterium]|nr:prepilin-type N-terminal cleavage/methylation domain-containing protein [SAR202 cluster bacterium]
MRHVTARDRGQQGFTLLEVLVAVSIMALIGSALVGSLNQINRITSRGGAQLATSSDVRTSMRWLADDFQMAATSTLSDGAAPVSCAALSPSPCLTLTWRDEYQAASVSHTSTYAMVDTELRRTYDGTTHAVARNVSDASFSRVGSLVTVMVTSTDEAWADISKSATHFFYMRPN